MNFFKRLRSALRPMELTFPKVLLAAAVTAVACVVSWRVSVALATPLAMLALLAAPISITLVSLTLSLASLTAVAVVAIALLPAVSVGGSHTAGFVFSALALMLAFAAFVVVNGRRLSEATYALGEIRSRSNRMRSGLSRAGVCLVILDRKLAWVEANDAAWSAFGFDLSVLRGADGRVEIDDEAASALMHSGSRDAWRQLVEQVKADLTYRARYPRETHGLRPYEASLHNLAGGSQRFRFTVTVSDRGDLVFVGFPLASGEALDQESEELAVQRWMRGVVRSIEKPAVVLQSDGLVIAHNETFEMVARPVQVGDRIFDFPMIHGTSEAQFGLQVWHGTRHGATELDLVLERAGEGVGARLVPPGAPHMEAVLVLFMDRNSVLPAGFSEHTQPADLN
jgi:PAS domain-containing protein